MAASDEVAKSVSARAQPSHRADSESYAFQNTGHGWWNEGDVAGTVRTPDGGGSGEATLIAPTVSAKFAKQSGGYAGAEHYNLVAQEVADPITRSFAKHGGASGGKDSMPHNLVAEPQSFYSTESRCDNIPPPGVSPPLKVGSNGGGQAPAIAMGVSGLRRAGDGGGATPTLIEDYAPTLGSHHNPGQGVLAFDTTQITHPENRSRPDDRSPQLSESGHPPAVATGFISSRVIRNSHTSNQVGIKPDAEVSDALSTDGPGAVLAPRVHPHCEAGSCCFNPNECDANDCWLLRNPDRAPPVSFQPRVGRNGRGSASEVVPALSGADAGETSDMRPCVATFKPSHFTRDKDGAPSDLAPPLSADADKGDQDPVLHDGAAVRRLTPRECERLQAFQDDYTLIKFRGKDASDGPRYRALGNSMNVKDVGWILRRIEENHRCP